MAGFLSTWVVISGLLAAAPGGFDFDGPRVSARTTSSTGFFIQSSIPFGNQTERGSGSAELSVQDRVTAPGATYGDTGRLNARFHIGGAEYVVELDQVGFPPAQARGAVSSPLPRFQQPAGGGAILDVDLHGTAPIGVYYTTRVHAAAAVWGLGKVWRNGQLLTDTAIIHAAALTAGARSDDDIHGVLPAARPGDFELYVLAWNLPLSAEPRGFIQFSFDDVAIDWNGVPLPSVASIPNGVGPAGGAIVSNTPVAPGSSFGLSLATPTPVTPTTPEEVSAVQSSPVAPFVNPDRVTVVVGNPAPDAAALAGTGGSGTPTGTTPDPFLGAGRSVGSEEARAATGTDVTAPGAASAGGIITTPTGTTPPGSTDPFLSDARVATSAELATPSIGGLAPVGQTSLGTSGSFSVVTLGPAVSGAAFSFGTTSSSNLTENRTPPLPGTSATDTPAVPLVATPRPLNGQSAVPLVQNPSPLTAQTPVPLVATPQPLNAQPPTSNPGVPGTAPTTSTTPTATSGTSGSTPAAAPAPAATTPAATTPAPAR